ncbi:MAG: SAM-dependent methyltransferase [Rhizobiaceae bacterium]
MNQTPTLRDRIKRRIELSGPMSVAEYMHVCMSDPAQGYYTSTDPIGRRGDFVTAPEISQLFGEMIGLWAVGAWEAMGKPDSFALVEAGPGNGTLIGDILRTVRHFPQFMQAASIHLLEASPRMIERQRERTRGHDVTWHANLAELPPVPLILMANEFLDVLAFRQYVRSGGHWHEHCIGLDGGGELAFMLGAATLDPAFLPTGWEREPDGSVFEYAPAREAWVQDLSHHLCEHGGLALLIDYGQLQSGFGDTFQAVENHKPVSPLGEPGRADLTSHVDFSALERAAREAGNARVASAAQGDFLLAMGLLERAGALGATADAGLRDELSLAVERLAGPQQMGNLFKVMAISGSTLQPGSPPLPPFTASHLTR